MTNRKNIPSLYESTWKQLLEKNKDETFDSYERNWPLKSFFKKNEKLLDLGSGNSVVGEYAKKNYGCDVTALDISPSAIADAQIRGVKGIVGSVEERLPFDAETFDTVFWGDNIEHVFFPKQVLDEIRRVLKKTGRVIISTPNQAYWRYRLFTLFTGGLPKTEGYDNPPWEWTHIRFFTWNILKDLLRLCGFHEVRFVGVSRRRLDIPLLNIFPGLFGMIFIVEANKN